MALIRDGKRICGETAFFSGRCERCGYAIDPGVLAQNNIRHGGVCSKCGGRMVCMMRIRPDADVCHHHRHKTKKNIDINRAQAERHEALLRGAASRLPPDLQKLYIEAFEDPRLLSLRNEIAIFAVRQAQLSERLNTGESSAAWASLLEFKGAFESANARMSQSREAGDQAGVEQAAADAQSALRSLFRVIDKAKQFEDGMHELLDLCERIAELKRLQHARLKDLRQTLTLEQALELVASLVGCVRRVVRDRPTLTALEADLAKVLRLPAPELLPCRTAAQQATEVETAAIIAQAESAASPATDESAPHI